LDIMPRDTGPFRSLRASQPARWYESKILRGSMPFDLKGGKRVA